MYDLNVRLKSSKEKDMKMAVKRMFELGWDCVVWTTIANGKATGNMIKPIKGVQLEPLQKRSALELRSLVTSSTAVPDLRQLTRLTMTVDDVIDAQSLTVGNVVLNSFDIVAVRPGNMKVMAYLCKTAEIDIITLDFTHRLPFATNKKLLDEAVKRGIFIEILYSPIIGIASGARQEVFANTRTLIQYLRGRNIILSSGADNLLQIRGPMDVCNIGVALGLTNEQAMNSIANNCALVIKHATARRSRYLPLEIINKLDFNQRFPELNFDNSQSFNHNVSVSSLLSNDKLINDDVAEMDDRDEIEDFNQNNQNSNKRRKNNDPSDGYMSTSNVLNYEIISNDKSSSIQDEDPEEIIDMKIYEENEEDNEDDKERTSEVDVEEEEEDEEEEVGFMIDTARDINQNLNENQSDGTEIKSIEKNDDNSVVEEDLDEKVSNEIDNNPKNEKFIEILHENDLDEDENDEDENGFELGDSFISFSNSPPAPSSSRKTISNNSIDKIVENRNINTNLKSKNSNIVAVAKSSSSKNMKKLKINSLKNSKINMKNTALRGRNI